MKELIRKYNVPGPRYTSYPTVPYWSSPELKARDWESTIKNNYDYFKSDQISLYIHLPFCESLCTFCGCHKRITKNHSVETPYIDTVLKEWQMYLNVLPFTPQVKELHLGGGTPTFFRADELVRLVENLLSKNKIDRSKVDLSFEAHPNNTSEEHLQKLLKVGFTRLSLGIQDYSPTVQKAINRIQSFEQVSKVHLMAKELGYTSISHDLVFGLPKQTLVDINDTIDKTLQLKPDRISLYSYAHVPWIKGVGQRGFDENDLPKDEVKRELYEVSKSRLLDAGYIEVGMDHFALPHDDLAIAFMAKNLHRNFMGYTTQNTNMLIGLGMSAISDSWFGFAQNLKSVEEYSEAINNNKSAVFRGHILSKVDLRIRRHILNLMCHFETEFSEEEVCSDFYFKIKDALEPMVIDELVEIDFNKIRITDKGTPFVRNACMQFDQYLNPSQQVEKMFSSTI